MKISLDQYERMSPYVRRVWWDCIMAKREAEQEQQRRQSNRNDGTTRVRW